MANKEPKKLNLKSKIEKTELEESKPKLIPKKLDLKSKINIVNEDSNIDNVEIQILDETLKEAKPKHLPKKLNLKSKINTEIDSTKIDNNISVSEDLENFIVSDDNTCPSIEEVEVPVEIEETSVAEETILPEILIEFPVESTIPDEEIFCSQDEKIEEVETDENEFEEIVDDIIIDDESEKDELITEEVNAQEIVMSEDETINDIEEDNIVEDVIKEDLIEFNNDSEKSVNDLREIMTKDIEDISISKPIVSSDKDVIIEAAKLLNENNSVDKIRDNLSDEILSYQHGLTDNQISSMSFPDLLKEILKDEDVTDISFNGKGIFIQNNKKGRYHFSDLVSERTVESFIKDNTNSLNLPFSVEDPIVDCEIKDIYTPQHDKVLRLNAVQESISPYGNTLSLRITQPKLRLTEGDDKFAPKEVFKLLEAMIRGNLNMLISGRTGSGKTELQKFLIKNIRDVETIVLIEDTKDTNLKGLYPEKNITSWITNPGIKRPIDFDVLIKASLRNNPDWIIISETRGSEAYSMIKSGLSGHKIITTLHSDSAETNIDRLIHMCKEKYDLDQLLLGQMITSVFDIGVHIDYDVTEDGIIRYVCEIVEYNGYNELGADVNKIFEVALQPVKNQNGELTYQRVYKYGKISQELFSKLAKKKVLTPEISKFIKEDYYEKEN